MVAESYTKKEKKITNQVIYQSIKKMILNGEILPGQSLKQEKLAADYGVSKIPIRETLKRLESDGLVVFKGKRGAFAVQHSVEEILEMLDIRVGLECRAIELAIPQMTESDFQLASRILDMYEQTNDLQNWSLLNRQFHDCLYAPCGLPRLVSMIRNIDEKTGLFIRLEVTMASGFERPHFEHKEILKACEDENVALAVQLLKTHIEHTKKEVAAHFRRKTLSRLN